MYINARGEATPPVVNIDLVGAPDLVVNLDLVVNIDLVGARGMSFFKLNSVADFQLDARTTV